MNREFYKHLSCRSNHLLEDILSKEWFDTHNDLLFVKLFDFGNNLTGYQRYNFKARKLKANDPKGRYYTYRNKNSFAVFGTQYWENISPVVFVTEGIWDCISMLHIGDSIAVLSNNPVALNNQLSLLSRPTVAICQGDKAGKLLASACDYAIYLPEGKDANDLSLQELVEYVQSNNCWL